VKAFFEWDEMRSSFYSADIIDALADRAQIGPDTTVVDVGTGTGFVAAGLAGQGSDGPRGGQLTGDARRRPRQPRRVGRGQRDSR